MGRVSRLLSSGNQYVRGIKTKDLKTGSRAAYAEFSPEALEPRVLLHGVHNPIPSVAGHVGGLAA